MASDEHLAILNDGVEAWNAWRRTTSIDPDLSHARLASRNLAHMTLTGANLSGADLGSANLCMALLVGANLAGANLVRANFLGANLSIANLAGADMTEAWLAGANLQQSNLTSVNLTRAKLQRANLVDANLSEAILQSCEVFGVSAWRINLTGAVQSDLVITDSLEPRITVPNLEIAQFIYLLLYNDKIRHVINTVTAKAVLLLGRFTPERKAVLDRLRNELQRLDLLPIIFDFEGPKNRDFTETVSTLAHMARFVIADLTDPRSIPQELQAIVPGLPSVPVIPIIQATQDPWAMFGGLKRYPWVLEPFRYDSVDHLCDSLAEHVIARAIKQSAEAPPPH